MASAGFLIYSGVVPLLKILFTIIFGFILERRNLFPSAAVRGASQVSMNVSLPCLLFANIVPAFTPSNISAIGPLALTAIIYVSIGFVFGFIIREIFYVPRNFWQGIIIATALSNWGNLPTAVVLSITAQPPFNPDSDPALGVSFVSIFILVFQLIFWVFGGAASLRWDFLPEVPQGEAAQVRVPWSEKPIGRQVFRILGRKTDMHISLSEKNIPEEDGLGQVRVGVSVTALEMGPLPHSEMSPSENKEDVDPDIALAQRSSRLTRHSTPSRGTPQEATRSRSSLELPDTQTYVHHSLAEKYIPESVRLPVTFVGRLLRPLQVVITPVTIALLISIVCAVVPDLKALFTDATSSGGPDWTGPDGRPPLAFVLDTAEFVGGIVIPLSLILLGASFSKMTVPKPISRLPIGAILAVTCCKLVFLPIIGVFVVQTMTKGGLIPKANLAERFVAMFLSGTPTAVNQLIVANLYAPDDGGVDTLAALLLVQYVFMFVSSAALSAVSLLLL